MLSTDSDFNIKGLGFSLKFFESVNIQHSKFELWRAIQYRCDEKLHTYSFETKLFIDELYQLVTYCQFYTNNFLAQRICDIYPTKTVNGNISFSLILSKPNKITGKWNEILSLSMFCVCFPWNASNKIIKRQNL